MSVIFWAVCGLSWIKLKVWAFLASPCRCYPSMLIYNSRSNVGLMCQAVILLIHFVIKSSILAFLIKVCHHRFPLLLRYQWTNCICLEKPGTASTDFNVERFQLITSNVKTYRSEACFLIMMGKVCRPTPYWPPSLTYVNNSSQVMLLQHSDRVSGAVVLYDHLTARWVIYWQKVSCISVSHDEGRDKEQLFDTLLISSGIITGKGGFPLGDTQQAHINLFYHVLLEAPTLTHFY